MWYCVSSFPCFLYFFFFVEILLHEMQLHSIGDQYPLRLMKAKAASPEKCRVNTLPMTSGNLGTQWSLLVNLRV